MDKWKGLTENLKAKYAVVRVVKSNSEKELLLLQNRVDGNRVMLRNYPGKLTSVYELLNQKQLPNIPRVLETGKKEAGSYVLEEFIEGKPLDNGNYTLEHTLDILKQVCTALDKLHEIGVVHRDVKPGNLIETEEGKVYLIDLDAARIYKTHIENDTCALGTTGYAAPEQFRIVQSDHRADIFALGVTLNVLLTGEHPSKQLCTGRMRHIVLKCTQMDPKTRYQTVKAVWKEASVLAWRKKCKVHKRTIEIIIAVITIGLFAVGGMTWKNKKLTQSSVKETDKGQS